MGKAATGADGDVGGRQRLLTAARRLFAAKGYSATTVRDILRVAGVTAPVLYYHFGSKQGMFLALVREGSEKLDAALAEALAHGASAIEKARGYCLALAAIRREHADLALTFEAMTTRHPEATPFFDPRSMVVSVVDRLAAVIRAGVASGELRACNPDHAALALLGTIAIVRRRFAVAPGPAGLDEQLAGTLDLVLAGLRAAPTDAASRPAGGVRRRVSGERAARSRRHRGCLDRRSRAG